MTPRLPCLDPEPSAPDPGAPSLMLLHMPPFDPCGGRVAALHP